MIAIILVAGGVYYVIKKSSNSDIKSFIVEPPALENEITRQEVMKDASEKISEISPVKPVLGGNWFVTRFWFVQGSDKDFYIEYEDGHILRQILVEAKKDNGKINYKVIAYFEPGQTTWQLKTGEDKFFGHLLDLYEHSEEIGEWLKKN